MILQEALSSGLLFGDHDRAILREAMSRCTFMTWRVLPMSQLETVLVHMGLGERSTSVDNNPSLAPFDIFLLLLNTSMHTCLYVMHNPRNCWHQQSRWSSGNYFWNMLGSHPGSCTSSAYAPCYTRLTPEWCGWQCTHSDLHTGLCTRLVHDVWRQVANLHAVLYNNHIQADLLVSVKVHP